MIAAGRACRPTAEPTTTVLVGMVLLLWWGWDGYERSDGGDLGGAAACSMDFRAITANAPTTTPAIEGDEVADDVDDGEEHEDAAVRGPHRHVERLDRPPVTALPA